MKKKSTLTTLFFSALLGGLTLTSCGKTPGTQQKQETKLVSIEVNNPKVEYKVGDEFVKPTVIAHYDDNSTKDVTNDASFNGFTTSTTGTHTITVSYEGKVTSYNITVTSISVTFLNLEIDSSTKTRFNFEEDFVNPVVIAKYSDGSSKNVSNLANIDSSKFDKEHSGTYEITVTYTEGTISKEIKYNVIVETPTNLVQKIEFEGEPKVDYNIGDEFVKPKVIAIYSDSTREDVTSKSVFTGYDMSVAGFQTVTVTYTQDTNVKTKTYSITIVGTETKVKFAIFADIQLCAAETGDGKTANFGETANAPLALEQHLKYAKSQGINILLMNGDITNQANEHYYNYFDSIVTKVYGSNKSQWPEFVWTMGNHEWWEGTSEIDPRTGNDTSNYVLPLQKANAAKLFNDHARIESSNLKRRSAIKYATNVEDTLPSYYKVINGVPFLAISAINSSGAINNDLKTEINSWLDEIKELSSVKAGGPIFVEYHYPLATSMTHGQGSHEANTSTINEIFGNIPNAIIFTGDTHFPGINERSINQVDYTTINVGTSSYSRMVDASAVIATDYDNVTGGNKSDGGDLPQGNSGYKNAYTPTIQIVEVFSNNTTKIQRKMTNPDGSARKVAEDWTIPAITSKQDFTYTNDRFQKTSSAQKLYGKDGASWENEDKLTFGVNEETHQMTVKFIDPVEYHFVEHFDININGTHHYFASNYYKYLEERGQNYFVVENVPHADSYTVEVTAYDFYDNPSLNKLTANSNEANACIEPIDFYFADQNYNYSDIETRNNLFDVATGSSSSNEFYYKGIQKYDYGAIFGELINVEKQRNISDYISLIDGYDTEPTVTCAVKNLGEGDLTVGLTVVNSKGEWKSDFGLETQQTVTGNGWTTLNWNLKTLCGITSKEEIKTLRLKAKSSVASTDGYEMNFLVDNIDLNDGGVTPQPEKHRGEVIVSGQDTTITLDEQVPLTGKISIDLKLDQSNTTGKVAIALLDNTNWDDYFGYYSFFSNATMENSTTGVTIVSLSDGFFRVTFNLPELVKIHGANLPSTFIDTIYVRGAWTNIDGRIDVNPPEDVKVIRGERFTSNQDYTFEMKSNPISINETISIDFKFDEIDSSKKISIMLGQGWDNYFGYFDIYSTGKLSSEMPGIKTYQLDDGYVRVVFTPTELSKFQGTKPDSYINLIYIRGIWSNANGYIDVNANTGNIVRGQRFENGVDFTKDYKTNIALTDTFVFDIKFDQATEENYINFMLGQGWSKYYGYFKIKGDGTLGDTYNGVTIQTLNDGYYRITMVLSQLTKVNDCPAPDEYINLFYVSQSRSSGSGLIDLNPIIE